MPLGVADALNTLSDAVNMNMDFWIGQVHVSSFALQTIRDHIRAENILVVPGTQVTAYYDPPTDILTLPGGSSPATIDQKALILHECCHALVDVFTYNQKVTRHNDEIAAYMVQHAFLIRSNQAWSAGPLVGPWPKFFDAVGQMVRAFGLNTTRVQGIRVPMLALEHLRQQLIALPGVNYGAFQANTGTGADSLKRSNLFVNELSEPVSTRSSSVSYETYPDPSDDYLIRTLGVRYAASDVKGFGTRLRELRKDFALCSTGRAKALLARFIARKQGDRVSELFYDHLSTEGRAILLRVLASRK